MKARIIFETTEEFRDCLLEESKKQNVQFTPFIRKVLRDYLANPYKLYDKTISVREQESASEFLPYQADEGENGDNIKAEM